MQTAPHAARRVPHPPAAGGHHLLADFWVGDADPLRWTETWEALLPEACRAAGATVLGARFHQFQPAGVTGIVLLAESHASVHTWPEAGLVTLDVFTCGALDAAAIVETIRHRLAPVRERVTAVARGDVAQPEAAAARIPTRPASAPRRE
jgi:S-adenosylmethionine decarboxylase